MTGILTIDTHHSVLTEDWKVELNGVDITQQINKIEIISEAMKTPIIRITFVTVGFELPSGIEGEIITA